MAILLFTVIIKIVLMPLSLWCQWNSIVMVKIMPELNRIKVKYFGDAETIGHGRPWGNGPGPSLRSRRSPLCAYGP